MLIFLTFNNSNFCEISIFLLHSFVKLKIEKRNSETLLMFLSFLLFKASQLNNLKDFQQFADLHNINLFLFTIYRKFCWKQKYWKFYGKWKLLSTTHFNLQGFNDIFWIFFFNRRILKSVNLWFVLRLGKKKSTSIFHDFWRHDLCHFAKATHIMRWQIEDLIKRTDDANGDIQYSGVISRANSIHQQGLNFISVPLDKMLNTFWFNLLQWIASHFSHRLFLLASQFLSLLHSVSKLYQCRLDNDEYICKVKVPWKEHFHPKPNLLSSRKGNKLAAWTKMVKTKFQFSNHLQLNYPSMSKMKKTFWCFNDEAISLLHAFPPFVLRYSYYTTLETIFIKP